MVEYCINSDRRLENSWQLLQEIYKFRDKCVKENAEEELLKIISHLEENNIEQMIKVAKTYRHWFKEICNSFITYGPYNQKCSNGYIEGKNRLCKEIKAFSCGFNNFEIFRTRILYISEHNKMIYKKDSGKRKLYSKNKKKGGKNHHK